MKGPCVPLYKCIELKFMSDCCLLGQFWRRVILKEKIDNMLLCAVIQDKFLFISAGILTNVQ